MNRQMLHHSSHSNQSRLPNHNPIYQQDVKTELIKIFLNITLLDLN